MNKELIIKECIESVNKIFNNYNDDMIFKRIHQYICNQMPIVINNYSRSLTQQTELSTEHDYFVEFFLEKNRYFYVSNTNKFFYYDGGSYHLFTEDDILFKILTSIREKTCLYPWKQKTKNNIMKRIKNTNLLDSIPESKTIQKVINLFVNSHIFNTKEEVKYFLTILGDNILKKNTNLFHIISNDAKDFIRELNNICNGFIGCNCNSSFKYKFHDHNYNLTRIININNIEEKVWLDIVMKSTIDIICVGCHYSNRYNGSDNSLIENNIDESISEQIFYLKEKTPEMVVDEFIKMYIEKTSSKIQTNLVLNKDSEITQINMKDMQYLWKHFLEHNKLPNVIFQNTFKKIIISKLSDNYNSEFESFIGLSSKHLPLIKLFLEYWNNNIIYEENDEYEYEISEIILIFKKWCFENYNNSNVIISEKKALDIISYFFPKINIEKSKNIYQIKCVLWDKKDDILCAYESFKLEIQNKYGNDEKNVSIYDFYNYYTNMFKETKLIVAKQYFEKFIFDTFENDVIDNNYLRLKI